jgi:hypothetical protein
LNSRRSFRTSALLALIFFALAHLSFAGAIEQIRPISKLPELDLRKLQRGEIASARGPLGPFVRGVYGESCYFIRATVPAVGEKLLHWNSARHPELDVAMLREYRWPAQPNVWDALILTSVRSEDKWLTERTWQLNTNAKSDLHVTRGDIAAFQETVRHGRNASASDRDAAVSAFWRKILHARSDALAGGGFAALPAYSADGAQIDSRAEFDNLMRLAPAITSHFRALISGAPFKPAPPSPAVEVVPYWQVARARGHTNLHGAFLVARKGAPSWQVADCTYYVSDTYFMSVSLYELFPQDNGTLVWQIDFASAPFRAYAGGLDRLFAGSEMVKDAAQTAKLFRTDVEKNQ